MCLKSNAGHFWRLKFIRVVLKNEVRVANLYSIVIELQWCKNTFFPNHPVELTVKVEQQMVY